MNLSRVMPTIKADLHYHGPIGFQPYWLKVQGYEGKNLLKEIADACFRRNLGICAITSDEDEIPKNSLHDRFNWLKENCLKTLPREYKFYSIGDNTALIELYKKNKKLFLINGQTVRTKEKGVTQTSGLTKRGFIDYLVVGSNQIPNHKPLEETVKRVYEAEFIGIAEHALCEAHGGMGRENLERLLPYMHAIEGHNSQLRFNWLRFLPKIGKEFAKYQRKLNREIQQFAKDYDKPWIANSDGHRIEDVGISYNEFDAALLDDSSEEKFMRTFKDVIVTKKFTQHCDYQGFFSWFDWTLKLKFGYKKVTGELQ